MEKQFMEALQYEMTKDNSNAEVQQLSLKVVELHAVVEKLQEEIQQLWARVPKTEVPKTETKTEVPKMEWSSVQDDEEVGDWEDWKDEPKPDEDFTEVSNHKNKGRQSNNEKTKTQVVQNNKGVSRCCWESDNEPFLCNKNPSTHDVHSCTFRHNKTQNELVRTLRLLYGTRKMTKILVCRYGDKCTNKDQETGTCAFCHPNDTQEMVEERRFRQMEEEQECQKPIIG